MKMLQSNGKHSARGMLTGMMLINFWWIPVIIVGLGIAILAYKSCGDNPPISLKSIRDTRIHVSPEEIVSIRDIGQWEFLSVSTEELTEWHRSRTFGNDHLVRIYTGTLRLGLDMTQAREDWFTSQPDSTASLRLPEIKLLDDNFIDETRTRSFYQKGTIPPKVLDDLYEQARQAMLKRCLTTQNINVAEHNAREQFARIFHALGFKKVEIVFEKRQAKSH